MVVTPAEIFARPAARSVWTPPAIISSLSSAVEQPCSTISLRRSLKSMTS
jgi:hypothetical protein